MEPEKVDIEIIQLMKNSKQKSKFKKKKIVSERKFQTWHESNNKKLKDYFKPPAYIQLNKEECWTSWKYEYACHGPAHNHGPFALVLPKG